jgi:sugar phosphate isomerase/epimerase
MMRAVAASMGIALLLALAQGAAWAAADSAKPFRGLRLRGVNYPLQAITEEAHFDVLARWRVNVIRLGIPYKPERATWPRLLETTEPVSLDAAAAARVRDIIGWAGKRGIHVIIDVHGCPGVRDGPLWSDFAYHDMFVRYWELIAAEFKDMAPVIGYDLLNEPGAGMAGMAWGPGEGPWRPAWSPPEEWKRTPRDYDLLMGKAAAAIRTIDPNTTLIIEGGFVGGMARNFRWLAPVDDANTVYSFHMYEPHNFTMQGIKGRPLGVEYPHQRGEERVDRSWLRERMRPVCEFQQKHGVEIFLGEFSCARWTDDKGGLDYLRDVLELAEEYGWHHCYHAFRAASCWDAEQGDDPDNEERSGETPRAKLLREYFARNREPAGRR